MWTFSGVTTDSRTVVAGDLFVGPEGRAFRWHNYVRQVIEQGAAASAGGAARPGLGRFPLLVVRMPRLALVNWPVNGAAVHHTRGGAYRQQRQDHGEGMIARDLRAQAGADDQVLATKGNLNNDIGMPLTLLECAITHRYA